MTSPNYPAIRDGLLRSVEDEKLYLYFDTKGIPTTSVGYTMITGPNRFNGQRWSVIPEHLDKFSQVMGHSPQEKQQFRQLMTQVAETRQRHNFRGQIQLDSAFARSEYGQAVQRVVGPLGRGRRMMTPETNGPMRITLTRDQSFRILGYAAQEHESKLNNTLREAHCPQEALSDKQRAALLAMVYHGTAPQAENIATQIGKYYRSEINAQQLNNRIDTLGANSQFPRRAAQQIIYLKDLGPRLRQQRSEAEPFNASPEAIRTVEALHEKLQANVGKQIEAAGAGRFADSMVAECTYQCIKKGITAENINHMFVDTNQNRIFIDTKLDGKIAVIDAFEAAKVDPTERLQAATQTQEEKVQQQIQEQNLQLAQQQERSGPKMG